MNKNECPTHIPHGDEPVSDNWFDYEDDPCPHCGEGTVSYYPKDAGLWICECDVCGREWWEHDEDLEQEDE